MMKERKALESRFQYLNLSFHINGLSRRSFCIWFGFDPSNSDQMVYLHALSVQLGRPESESCMRSSVCIHSVLACLQMSSRDALSQTRKTFDQLKICQYVLDTDQFEQNKCE